MDVVARVRRYIREHELIRPGARVVAAVSGGSDSVALAWMLHELHAAGDLQLVGLAHFNHQLREQADRDERHVMALAEALGVPLLSDRADVASAAKTTRRSIEHAARSLRYEFFARAVSHFAADSIALGHTRDDQAETVLLRLVRGAGPRGLSGMHPRSGIVIRPLLDCRREELRDFLVARQQAGCPAAEWVDDHTNADVAIPRNRVRAELLPLLAARFNPGIVDVLANEAELARELWLWLERTVSSAAERLVRTDGAARVLDIRGTAELDPAVQRGLIWRLMSEVAETRPIAAEHVAQVLRLLRSDAPSRLDLPGQRVQRVGASLVLSSKTRPRARVNLFRYSLSIPGEVRLTDAGWVVAATRLNGADAAALRSRAAVGNGPAACVRADLLPATLGVRNRRPGDRFRPAGGPGRRKLQDFFVDRKIDRGRRDSVPLVVDDADRIVWVAGHRIDEAFRVTGPSDHVLLLTLKALGGSV